MLELQTQRSHPALDSRGQTVRETKETEGRRLNQPFLRWLRD